MKGLAWLDAAGRAVKVSFTADVAGSAGAIHLTRELQLSELGAPVEVTPSPVAETVPLLAALGVVAALGPKSRPLPAPIACA